MQNLTKVCSLVYPYKQGGLRPKFILARLPRAEGVHKPSEQLAAFAFQGEIDEGIAY